MKNELFLYHYKALRVVDRSELIHHSLTSNNEPSLFLPYKQNNKILKRITISSKFHHFREIM